MVTRRSFLGALAALPAITALAGSPLRLHERKLEHDFTTSNFRVRCTWLPEIDAFQVGNVRYTSEELEDSQDPDMVAVRRLINGMRALHGGDWSY